MSREAIREYDKLRGSVQEKSLLAETAHHLKKKYSEMSHQQLEANLNKNQAQEKHENILFSFFFDTLLRVYTSIFPDLLI